MNSLTDPLYVTRFEEIFWGGLLVAITMVMHGFGMLLVLRAAGSLTHRFEPKPSFAKGMFTLILASWMILVVHLLEVSSWSEFFLLNRAVNAAHVNRSLCYYVAVMWSARLR